MENCQNNQNLQSCSDFEIKSNSSEIFNPIHTFKRLSNHMSQYIHITTPNLKDGEISKSHWSLEYEHSDWCQNATVDYQNTLIVEIMSKKEIASMSPDSKIKPEHFICFENGDFVTIRKHIS
jgi:hypothetical protein